MPRSSTRWSCWPAAGGSATCSRAGSPTWGSSATRVSGSPTGVRSLTLGWFRSWCRPGGAVTRSACSASWRPADRLDRVVLTVAIEQVADGAGRQGGLGQEADRGAGRYQVRVVLLGVRRDQDDLWRRLTSVAVQLPGHVEAALAAEVDVHQRYVGSQLVDSLRRLGAGRCRTDDGDALALQQAAGGVQEARVVIDDEAPKHGARIADGLLVGITASWTTTRRRPFTVTTARPLAAMAGGLVPNRLERSGSAIWKRSRAGTCRV